MPIRNITLPPTHNQRAPEQWRIISEHVDFDGKTVLDLGCGHGDLLWRTLVAGAESCHGIEQEQSIIDECNQAVFELMSGGIVFSQTSIERWMRAIDERMPPGQEYVANVAICFSVLPYLDNPTATLHWIRQHSQQALIECQLSGDGPGFDWLKCPQDMRRWLDSIGWQSVERIGETTVKDRGTKRGIWLCQ